MASCDPTADTIPFDWEEEEKETVPGPSGVEENGADGMQAKRRKKEDKYRGFEPEEKVCLMKYRHLESKAKKILCETKNKLFGVLSRGNMPEGILYLKGRLDTLQQKTSLDPICIGFLGCTGAGKTSLLNALLGKKMFLPVSGSKTCTSCIVEVKRSKSEHYEAVVHLLSEEEWREEVKTLVELLRNDGNDEGEDGDEDEDLINAAEKLCTIYGKEAKSKSYEELLNAKLQVSIPPKRSFSIKEMQVEQFSQKLVPYIRVWDENPFALWPLIKYVEVSIPDSDMVPDGITFVDIPGTGDFNKRRDEMWKQSIDRCSVLWVIGEIVRIDGGKVPLVLLDKCIQAYLGGRCTDIALVVTKSDLLKLEEYISGDRGNKTTPINNKHDAILERNGSVKTTMERRTRDKLKKKLPSDSDIIHKTDLVYTVSAEEFWDPKHLAQEETEIPKLRKYIRQLYLKERERLVKDYMKEILGLHLLAENVVCKEQYVEVHFKESGLETFVKEKIDALGKELEKCFNQMEQPLREGVANAKRSHEKIVIRNLTRSKGFHKTLKAVCLNDGVFPSRTYGRIDLNEDLANPIYDKIASNFGSIFRMERSTRASLWSHLEKFQREVEEKIHEIAKDRKIPDDNGKIETFIFEVGVILKRLKEEALRRKRVIYRALPQSIQSSLKPHYEEASKIKGQKSCERMKNILREGVGKEVENDMFEKATSQVESYVLELKEEIMMTLRKDVSTLLKLLLVQQDRLAVKLPDIERECREIKSLFSKIQNGD